MNIIIKNRHLLYKGYKIKCTIGKKGLNYLKKEGDLTTPRGLFKMGLLYYRKDRIKLPNCSIKKKKITKEDKNPVIRKQKDEQILKLREAFRKQLINFKRLSK